MSHTVTIRFDELGYGPSYSMTCTEPAESLCHAVWDCSCESSDDCGEEGGRPWHESSYGEDRERHYGTYDPTSCNVREWFENSEDVYECIKGSISFDVASEWNGDYYEWRVIERKTADDWASRIDRDKLAEVLDGCFPGCDGPAAEDFIERYVVSAVDAVLAALPELMGGGSDE